MRHLAFQVDNLDRVVQEIKAQNLPIEPIRVDEFTGKRFTFMADPDDLPIEFYEI
jgi:glyoxylase I family protein